MEITFEHDPVYCLKCKQKTPNVDETVIRKIVPHLKCKCGICFTNKSTYLKHEVMVVEDSTSEGSTSGNETTEAPTNSRRKII